MAIRRPKPDPGDSGLSIFTPRAVTAATAVVDLGEGSSWRTWKFGNRDWQKEAWRLYDIVPEFSLLADRVGDSAAQARLYVAEVSETGEDSAETQDAAIAALAAIPLGTGAQRDEAFKLAGTDIAVGGECWIVGQGAAKWKPGQDNPAGAWFVVTGAAITPGDQVTVKLPMTRGGGKLPLTNGVDILARCYRAHPNDLDQANSRARSSIPVLREIELTTKRKFAELDSRLTGAGVMFLPEGVDFPRQEGDPEGIAGFMAYIQRAAAASMQDQSTASAMVPIMATLPDEMMQYVDQMKPVNFWSELSAEIAGMQAAAIARILHAYEIPDPNAIETSNHWNGWLMSEEGTKWIKAYLAPIADALTRSFLRPALTAMGVMAPERYAFAFDLSPLAVKPNRLDDALKLHERHLISDEEAVKAGAFTIEQMPTAQERVVQVLLTLIQADPSLLSNPAIAAALGLPEVAVAPTPAVVPSEVGEPDEDEADEQGAPNNGERPALTAALDRRIEQLALTPPAPPSIEAVFSAASKLLVLRALELAGGRLTSPAERRGRWAEVPRHELHARVGPITYDKAIKVTEGAWNHVPVMAADLGVNAGDVQALISGYVIELLTRGMPHHDDLLFATLSIANRGKGLTVGHG